MYLKSFLIIDDDMVDVMAIERLLQKFGWSGPIYNAQDGQEGIELLFGTNAREPAEKPCFVILDLNMPKVNGFEFLESVKRVDSADLYEVCVVTTSNDPADAERAVTLGAKQVLIKDVSLRHIDTLQNHLWHQYFKHSQPTKTK